MRGKESKNSLQIDQTSDGSVALRLSIFLLGTSSLQTLLPKEKTKFIFLVPPSPVR